MSNESATPSLRQQLEAQAAKPGPTPLFRVGDTVRILSSLQSNVHAIMDLLGKKGTVVSSRVTWLSKRVCYDVQVGDRIEPFEQDELDWRYVRKSK